MMTARKLATWHLRQAILNWKAAKSYTAHHATDVEAFRAIFAIEERTKLADFHFEAYRIIGSLREAAST
jgi:hypothetical protein